MGTENYKKRKKRRSKITLKENAVELWYKHFGHAGLSLEEWGSCDICLRYIEKRCSGGKEPKLCMIGKALKGESIYG